METDLTGADLTGADLRGSAFIQEVELMETVVTVAIAISEVYVSAFIQEVELMETSHT